jgi:hypothetical protein
LFGGKPRFARRRGAREADAVASGERFCGGLARRGDEERRLSREGGSNSVVESQPSKLLVAGSIPVSRSSLRSRVLVPKRELRLGEPREGCRAKARRAKADCL